MTLDSALRNLLEISRPKKNSSKKNVESYNMVQSLLDAINKPESAEELGNLLIQGCRLKKGKNNRVDMLGGDKTPIGVTRTIFGIFSKYLEDN